MRRTNRYRRLCADEIRRKRTEGGTRGGWTRRRRHDCWGRRTQLWYALWCAARPRPEGHLIGGLNSYRTGGRRWTK